MAAGTGATSFSGEAFKGTSFCVPEDEQHPGAEEAPRTPYELRISLSFYLVPYVAKTIHQFNVFQPSSFPLFIDQGNPKSILYSQINAIQRNP